MNDRAERRFVSLLAATLMAVCLAGLAVLPTVAGAQTESASVLERAKECYRQADYACAIQLLEVPVKQRQFVADTLVEAMELLARSYVQSGRQPDAKATFRELLCDRPEWRPDTGRETPEEVEVFFQALSEGPCVRPPAKEEKPAKEKPVREKPIKEKAPAAPGAKRLAFGALLGLNLAGISGDGLDWAEERADAMGAAYETKSATGLVGGAFAEYSFGPYVAVRPELLFSQWGGGYQVTKGAATYKETYTLNYVQVPLLAELIAPAVMQVKPYLLLGPSFAFKMGSKGEQEIAGSSSDGNINDLTSSFDFVLVMGGGLRLVMAPASVFLEGRYGMGTSGFLKDVDDQYQLKNHGIAVLAGVSF